MSTESALLVTFARPEESRAFRRCLGSCEPIHGRGSIVARGKIGATAVVVAHTGIGAAAARAAAQGLLGGERFWLAIGAGFAGGLDPRLAVGDSVLEEIPSSAPRRIVSSENPVETVAAKRALHAQTGAVAVDMETETLANACAAAGIPFLAIRAISDSADTDLPVPFAAWFDLQRQRPRPFGLMAYLARNPRRAPAFFRFVRTIPRVSAALAMAVEGCTRGFEHA